MMRLQRQDCERKTKKELLDFCVKHSIADCSTKSTKAQLCKQISSHFKANANASIDFHARGRTYKRGDGEKEWRLSELRDIMMNHGWAIPAKATKTQLCGLIAAKFKALAAIEKADDDKVLDYDNMAIEKLRQICVQRGLKGCQQTRKRETFIKKLTESKPRQEMPDEFRPPAGVSAAASNEKAKARKAAANEQSKENKQPPHKVSIGEKRQFDGNLMANVNNVAGNLAAMLFLLKKYKSIVCIPLKPAYLKDSGFGENQYCDFEICWTHIITAEGNIEHYMEWSYATTEELFWDDIENYCTKRFAIIPMYITGIVNTKQIAHHNYIVFDRELKTVERFEPNGTMNSGTIISKIYGEDMLNDIIRASARKRGYTYIQPLDFCPLHGPQSLEELQDPKRKDGDPSGFCTFWSVWYADRRLKHPEVPIKDLVAKLVEELNKKYDKKANTEMRTFIRNYTEHVDEERRRMIEIARTASDEDEEQIVTRALLNELIK